MPEMSEQMLETNTETLQAIPNAVATAAHVIRELGHLRQQRASLYANLQDLIATECRMAERAPDGWDDPEVKRIAATIDGFGAQLDEFTARIAALRGVLEETPTAPLPLVHQVHTRQSA